MKVLIIEDEARIAARIERFLLELMRSSGVSVTICGSLSEGIELIRNHPPDLLLLDLNLNGENGFEVLKSVTAESFHTIVISAYKEKAIDAFNYGVLDFIPKPFDKARLSLAMERLVNKEKTKGAGVKFIFIKKTGNILLFRTEEIQYIKGSGIYTEIHFRNGRTELHDKSLEKLEQLLPDYFLRIHKSYIADSRDFEKILVQAGSKYQVLLKNGEVLPVGRTRYEELIHQIRL
eukprot:gene12515-14691_t